MKKFLNLTVILAALMTAFSFSSCSDDDDDDAPSIGLDSYAVASGSPITGKITTSSDLKTATLLYVTTEGEATVSGWPLTKFNAATGAIVKAGDNNYTVRIEGLEDGTYKLRATDANGKESTKQFTVGDNGTDPGDVDTPLTTAVAFDLHYPQAGTRTAYGLTYDENLTASTARFTGSNIVVLTESAYNAITTVEELEAAYAAGSKVSSFNLSTGTGANYVITSNDGTLYLIKKTNLVFNNGVNTASFTEKH